jgi:hypothetical protein
LVILPRPLPRRFMSTRPGQLTRRYRAGSLVLETEWETAEGGSV